MMDVGVRDPDAHRIMLVCVLLAGIGVDWTRQDSYSAYQGVAVSAFGSRQTTVSYAQMCPTVNLGLLVS